MKLTSQWEKEWQEIDVPQDAVFQAIEKGLRGDEKVNCSQGQLKKSGIKRFFVKQRRLLVIAAALILLATASVASVAGNRQLKQQANKSDSRSTLEKEVVPTAPDSGAEGTGKSETKGKIEFYSDEAGTTEANQAVETSEKSAQKLIKTYDIIKETNDFRETIEGIEETVKSYGGYFSQSDITNQESDRQLRSARYTIRIPQAKIEEFSNALAKIGETISASENATDHSLSYSDNQSRIKALQTEEEALLNLLGKSDTVQEMINIQDRLSQVRSSKESLIQQNKLIDNQVAETEVQLSVSEVKKITKEKSVAVMSRVQDNWRDQMRFWQEAVQQLAVFFLSVGPSITAVIMLGIIWVIIKKRRV
ncbi:DUF4349 domain-containing protein [uncultured Vagococcus sp.]|uniref:DUF4349 domain-containing protein n=1 Tax=uncultured Vagococcus sp. TaxID=189676 RepID=UPI0028D22B7C|nr:DUF4349 domain-containing protein [uncultured Vagococcus sp.]